MGCGAEDGAVTGRETSSDGNDEHETRSASDAEVGVAVFGWRSFERGATVFGWRSSERGAAAFGWRSSERGVAVFGWRSSERGAAVFGWRSSWESASIAWRLTGADADADDAATPCVPAASALSWAARATRSALLQLCLKPRMISPNVQSVRRSCTYSTKWIWSGITALAMI